MASPVEGQSSKNSPPCTPKMKRVTFSPNLTNVKEYTSPYQDPTFMSTNDDDKWRRRAGGSYAIRLNYIEEALIKRFQNHFMVCFDAAKKCTTEKIREWFNVQLAGCGQKPWQIRSRKWIITKSKLRLSTIMWRKRDTPLS